MAENLELRIEDLSRLLEPGYLPLESGYMRLPDGYYLVAVLTRMPFCNIRMVEWWFAYGLSPREHTEVYKLWHPVDHKYGAWDDKWSPGNYIGASHIADEALGGLPPKAKLRIHFQDPSQYFNLAKLEQAKAIAICARIYFRGVNGGVELGFLTHFVRDRDVGCEVRSRFWLKPEYANLEIAKRLFQHCVEEMRNLAVILPFLYEVKRGR